MEAEEWEYGKGRMGKWESKNEKVGENKGKGGREKGKKERKLLLSFCFLRSTTFHHSFYSLTHCRLRIFMVYL